MLAMFKVRISIRILSKRASFDTEPVTGCVNVLHQYMRTHPGYERKGKSQYDHFGAFFLHSVHSEGN